MVAAPAGYGRILRKSDTAISAIVEESQLTGDQSEINEINSAIYCFTLEKLWPALAQVKPNNKHREIYLTDAVAILAAKGEKVLAQVAADSREVLGCNTRADLAEVDRIFREWKRAELMDAGVTIQLPETVLDRSRCHRRRRHRDRARRSAAGQNQNWRSLHHAQRQRAGRHDLGDDVVVEAHCLVAESRLDEGVIIGPFARLARRQLI